MTTTRIGLCCLLMISLLLVQARAEPVGSDFTFQGSLSDQGALANGDHDMTFTLHSHATDPAPVGSPLDLTDVPVTNGLFTVQLDFGAEAFDGDARWLQIDVNSVPLSPRQPMTATPHAIFSSKPWATTGDHIFNTNEGNVGIGTTTPSAKLDVVGTIRASAGYEFPDGSAQTKAAAPWAINRRNPQQIAMLRHYDAIESGHAFSLIDPASSIAFDGAHMWVTTSSTISLGRYNVTKIRTSDGAILGSFPVGTRPTGVAFDGANIWVANNLSGNVSKLRASDGVNLGNFAAGAAPQSVAFDGAHMWVTCALNQGVTKLRVSDGANLGTFLVGDSARGVAFDGVHIWVARTHPSPSRVTKLRASDGANLGTFNLSSQPFNLAFDGANIWVTHAGSFYVTKLRASDGANLGTFNTGAPGSFPHGIAFDGTHIWVSNNGNNTLTKLRASDGTNIATFQAGINPRGVAFDGANIWVATGNSNIPNSSAVIKF